MPASFRPPQLQDSIRKFADARLAPHAARIDADNNFPEIREFWKELGDMGLLGITAPGKFFFFLVFFLEHHIHIPEMWPRATWEMGS